MAYWCIKGGYRRVTGYYKGVTRLLHDFTGVLQGCYNGLTGVSHGVTEILQECYRGVTG